MYADLASALSMDRRNEPRVELEGNKVDTKPCRNSPKPMLKRKYRIQTVLLKFLRRIRGLVRKKWRSREISLFQNQGQACVHATKS